VDVYKLTHRGWETQKDSPGFGGVRRSRTPGARTLGRLHMDTHRRIERARHPHPGTLVPAGAGT